MKVRRLVILPVAASMMLLLSACQSGNVAAQVGDATIPTSDVDLLAKVQCDSLDRAAKDSSQSLGGQAFSAAQVRAGIMQTLIDAQVNRQVAEREHLSYDAGTLRSQLEGFEPVVDEAPAKDRDRLRELAELVFRGELQLYTRVLSELAAQGVSAPDEATYRQAAAKVQQDFRKSVDIEVNPEYGANADGVVGQVDPSLSLPVSSFAKKARAAQPDADWVADLPAAQRCG